MAKKRATNPSIRQADLGRRVLDTLTLGEAGVLLGALLTRTPAKSVEAALQSLPKDRAQALRQLLPSATAPAQIDSTEAPKPTDARPTDAPKPTNPKPRAKKVPDGDKAGSAATGAPKPRGKAPAGKTRRPQTGLSRNARLEAASQWLTTYTGKRIVRSYAKWFRVDRATALHDLQLLGVDIDPRYLQSVLADKRQRAKLEKLSATDLQQSTPLELYGVDYDENFAFIAGETEAGFPFGVSWEEQKRFDAIGELLPMSAAYDPPEAQRERTPTDWDGEDGPVGWDEEDEASSRADLLDDDLPF